MSEKRKPIDYKLRAKVLRRTDGLCFYCGRRLNGHSWHVDHMTPISRGGKDDFENYVPSCARCNTEKLTRDVEEYRSVKHTERVQTARESFDDVLHIIEKHIPSLSQQAQAIMNLAWDKYIESEPKRQFGFIGEYMLDVSQETVRHLLEVTAGDEFRPLTAEEVKEIEDSLPHWSK